jgi:uncharacterized DUF497 family protein
VIQFEWDEDKARSNRLKHGVSFEEATRVFEDPLALTTQDRTVNGEPRWQAIGWAGTLVLFVAYTVREEGMDEVVRIISARRASKKERHRYGKNR